MTRAVLGITVITLCLAAAPALAKDSGTELDRAIKLFNDFEDPKAAALLTELLKHSPAPDQAAKAHVYLGLIALNALKSDKARAEFMQALSIDATTELPFDASPKARLSYDQARKEVEREARQAPEKPAPVKPAPAQPPPAQPQPAKSAPTVASPPPEQPAPVKSAPPPAQPQPALEPKTKIVVVDGVDGSTPVSTGPSYAPSIVVASIGAAALIGGAVMGAISVSTLAQANAPGGDIGLAEAGVSQAGTQGLVADILFGAGGAGLAVGVILFIVEANSGGGSSSAVHATANGLSIAF